MAISVGVFDQIVLMIVLGGEKLLQRFQLDGSLLPDAGFQLVQLCPQQRKYAFVGIVDAG